MKVIFESLQGSKFGLELGSNPGESWSGKELEFRHRSGSVLVLDLYAVVGPVNGYQTLRGIYVDELLRNSTLRQPYCQVLQCNNLKC